MIKIQVQQSKSNFTNNKNEKNSSKLKILQDTIK